MSPIEEALRAELAAERATLEAVIARLEARIAELERRLGMDSSNSLPKFLDLQVG